MSECFSEEELEWLSDFATLREEQYIEDRKGISQTKYIVEVKSGFNWEDKKIPTHLVGLWMQDCQTDNTQISWFERLGTNDKYGYKTGWVKCKEVEVISVSYEEIDDE
jgi:hypothetical protein